MHAPQTRYVNVMMAPPVKERIAFSWYQPIGHHCCVLFRDPVWGAGQNYPAIICYLSFVLRQPSGTFISGLAEARLSRDLHCLRLECYTSNRDVSGHEQGLNFILSCWRENEGYSCTSWGIFGLGFMADDEVGSSVDVFEGFSLTVLLWVKHNAK